MKLFWTDRAHIDFAEQLDYIAEDSPAAAIRIEMEIESQVDRLIEFPEMGRPGRIPRTRELVISRSPYLVVYRVGEESIQILRVLHGAQLWP